MQPIFSSIIINLIKQPVCNEAYRLLAFYTVSFDTQKLIDRSVRELDAHLNIAKVYVKTEYGEQTARLTSREQLAQGQAFVKKHNDQDAADRVALGNVRYDLVGKLVEETA